MSAEIRLTEDGDRALREAQNFCWQMNVAIVASDHLLAGAFLVLREMGVEGLPDQDALRSGLEAVHGVGSERLTDNVMFGSNARDALNTAIGEMRMGGVTTIGAREIALGLLESGEVNPMFYSALGTTRAALNRAVQD